MCYVNISIFTSLFVIEQKESLFFNCSLSHILRGKKELQKQNHNIIIRILSKEKQEKKSPTKRKSHRSSNLILIKTKQNNVSILFIAQAVYKNRDASGRIRRNFNNLDKR